jgi:general secretion pathway protein I
MRLLRYERAIGAAVSRRLLKIGLQVFDRSQKALPLATLQTLLSGP